MENKNSLMFYVESENGTRYTIRLDPKRYMEVYEDNKRYYFDKFTKTKIPEEAFIIILEELISQPIKNIKNINLRNLYPFILKTRERIKRTLYRGFEIYAIMPSDEFLNQYLDKNMEMVILYVDIVDSTKLSQYLTSDKFATLVKLFAQEMSCIIAAYNGYILKYAGDSVIAFFPILTANHSVICKDVVNCARIMLSIVRYAMNPVLISSSYPQLKIKIGIDVGENNIVSIGDKLDIVGYTISITSKIVEFANAWDIIISKRVYDYLGEEKELFKELKAVWNYGSLKIEETLYRLEKRIK